MRLTLLLSSTLLLVSCIKSPAVSEGSSATGEGSDDAPYIWGNKTFPKTVHLSNDFTAAEVQNITDMAGAWKTAVLNKTFFSFGATVSNKSNGVNPDDLYDSTLGIYKTTDWGQFDEDALAITQIFARRYNSGKANEYLSVVHADILINYQWYDFETDDTQITFYYDLQTVILHEMGHFLGLRHVPVYEDRTSAYSAFTRTNYKASSVMYPSIDSSERKRVPQTWDIDLIKDKYNLGGSSGSGAIAAMRYAPDQGDPGIETKVLIELKANGECIHKENGVVVGRHPAAIKSYR